MRHALCASHSAGIKCDDCMMNEGGEVSRLPLALADCLWLFIGSLASVLGGRSGSGSGLRPLCPMDPYFSVQRKRRTRGSQITWG